MAEHRAHRTRWGSAARADAAFTARLAELDRRSRTRAAASTELDWLVMPSRYVRLDGLRTRTTAAA
jgi:hypothetical protein